MVPPVPTPPAPPGPSTIDFPLPKHAPPMNETTSTSPPIDQQTDSPTSRCDNYPQYLRDTLGYAYDATDRVSLRSREHHFEWLNAGPDELDSADPSTLDDFTLLGVARGWLAVDNLNGFTDVVDHLLEPPRNHDAVRYPEVVLLAGYTLGDHDAPDRGLQYLQTHDDLFDLDRDRREYALLEGRLFLQDDSPNEATSSFQNACEINDEAETRLDIATVCARIDARDRALEWLDRAEQLADTSGRSALTVDIDVWRDRLTSD